MRGKARVSSCTALEYLQESRGKELVHWCACRGQPQRFKSHLARTITSCNQSGVGLLEDLQNPVEQQTDSGRSGHLKSIQETMAPPESYEKVNKCLSGMFCHMNPRRQKKVCICVLTAFHHRLNANTHEPVSAPV